MLAALLARPAETEGSVGGRAALAAGRPIPSEAVDLMARPAIPKGVYTVVGGYGWRRAADRNGVRAHLRDRPYQDAEYVRPARRSVGSC